MFDHLDTLNSLWGDEPEEAPESEQNIEEEELDAPESSNDPEEPEFETVQSAKEYYKQRIQEREQFFQSQEFIDRVKSNYAQQILEAEQEAEQMKTLHKAFKNEPELMLKLYYPEYLGRVGIGVQFTNEEKEKVITNTLAKEFGKDFQAKFNQAEYNIPDTLSGKMYARQQEILNELNAQEKIAQKAWQDSQPNPEKLNQIIAQQRKELFPNMDDKQFNALIGELKDFQPNILDLDFAKNREAYIKAAYEEGLKVGRKNMGKEISNAGKVVSKDELLSRNSQKKATNLGTVYPFIPRY